MAEERRVRRLQGSRFRQSSSVPEHTSQVERVIVSGDLAAPRKPWAWRNIFRTAGALLAVGLVAWVAFFSGWLNVKQIMLKGSNTVSESQVQDSIGAYFQTIPWQKNILFTDTKELTDSLRKTYPTFSKVNIYRTIFLTLQVQVTETAPALIWKTGSQSWLISTDGRILRQATAKDSVKGSVTDTAQLSVEAGKKVADGGFVDFIVGAYKSASDQKLVIANVTISDTTQEAMLVLDSGIVIKTDTTKDAKSQVEAARKTLDTATANRKPVTQYIDTRVSGRSYYK